MNYWTNSLVGIVFTVTDQNALWLIREKRKQNVLRSLRTAVNDHSTITSFRTCRAIWRNFQEVADDSQDIKAWLAGCTGPVDYGALFFRRFVSSTACVPMMAGTEFPCTGVFLFYKL
jgi:hypothetical protein